MFSTTKKIRVHKTTFYTPGGLVRLFAVSVLNNRGYFAPARTFSSQEDLDNYLKQEGVENGYNS